MSETPIPIATLIAEGDPLTPPDWNEEKEKECQEQLSRIRQRIAEQTASIPCWQMRVARNPDYWKTFSPGGIRL